MAWITNITLHVGKVTPTIEEAKVTFQANFSNSEVAENGRYRVRAYLYEVDDARDFYIMKPDGRFWRHERGAVDESVGHIQSKWIRPNGENNVSVELEREWNFPDLDNNPFTPVEQFQAVVSIMPEMAMGDYEFSPQIMLDVG